jgi:hypothetical protein
MFGNWQNEIEHNHRMFRFNRIVIASSETHGKGKKKKEEINRLPWLGQSGRAAAGCACTAAALRC